MKKVPKKPRKNATCLGCRKRFASHSKFNRFCTTCQQAYVREPRILHERIDSSELSSTYRGL